MFECVDARTHGHRLESHPISSPCEPSAQVSLKKQKQKQKNNSQIHLSFQDNVMRVKIR